MDYITGYFNNWKIFVLKVLVTAVILFFIIPQLRFTILPFRGFDIGIFVVLLSGAIFLDYCRWHFVHTHLLQELKRQNRTPLSTSGNGIYVPDSWNDRYTKANMPLSGESYNGGEFYGNRILITYSSLLGSTLEIAQEIGNELRTAEYTVDVTDMKNVSSLENYSAVIIGVAIFTGPAGLGDIGNFTKKRFSEQLSHMPVAIFAVGPEGMNPDSVMTTVKMALSPISPVSSILFTAAPGQKKLSITMRFAKNKNIPSTDFQERDKIKSWARKLPEMLNV
ncbi:flavodoxin domain-containing protein [Methanoregula sp.]|uniref:flavodoxin domain-containing protein n=1 Tax=Methanoregula sp. TaxID=2052170 RepID=UPI003C719163